MREWKKGILFINDKMFCVKGEEELERFRRLNPDPDARNSFWYFRDPTVLYDCLRELRSYHIKEAEK